MPATGTCSLLIRAHLIGRRRCFDRSPVIALWYSSVLSSPYLSQFKIFLGLGIFSSGSRMLTPNTAFSAVPKDTFPAQSDSTSRPSLPGPTLKGIASSLIREQPVPSFQTYSNDIRSSAVLDRHCRVTSPRVVSVQLAPMTSHPSLVERRPTITPPPPDPKLNAE